MAGGGYAHYLDKDNANALLAWTRTAALAPVLGDYLDYLRASAYQGEADHAAVAKTLQVLNKISRLTLPA